MPQNSIVLCVACRIALGKLRRITNIAHALRQRLPDLTLTLLADSGSESVENSLTPDEIAMFQHIESARSADMATRLKSMNADVVIVDTMRVKDLHEIDARLCLILREVLSEEVAKFRLQNGREWDLVILPHPEGHWAPPSNLIGAKQVESVGWIYRSQHAGSSRDSSQRDDTRMILITTGGGSGEDRGNDAHSEIQHLMHRVRQVLTVPLRVVQVVGPRDRISRPWEGVDEITKAGPELHKLFPIADLVISAAGYNSVLELATTDVPVLLVPVPRYTDDQTKRATLWEKELGMCYSTERKEEAILWITSILEKRLRRKPADISPSGADQAAKLISQLLSN